MDLIEIKNELYNAKKTNSYYILNNQMNQICKLCKNEILLHHGSICSKLSTEYIIKSVIKIVEQNVSMYAEIITNKSSQFNNFNNLDYLYANYEIFKTIYIDYTIAKLILFMIKIFKKNKVNRIYCLRNILDILYICAEYNRMITYDWISCYICSLNYNECKNIRYILTDEICRVIKCRYIRDIIYDDNFVANQSHLSLFVIYCLMHNIVNYKNIESYLSLYYYICECNNDITQTYDFYDDINVDILSY